MSAIRINQKYIKIILATSVSIVVGVFLLSLVGRAFISEVIQEIEIKEDKEKIFSTTIGDEAPHWELKDVFGNTNKHADFLGTPLIITFWASWNSYSSDQIKILDDYLVENGGGILNVITINNQEGRSVVVNFIKRGGYNVQTFLDETGEVGEKYNISVLPITYFLDKNGIIQDAVVGVLSKEMLVEKTEKIIQ